MTDKPEAMLKRDRQPVDKFDPEERLFRRVSPDDWGDPRVEVDALDLPDMSVNRSGPFGHPPVASEPRWVLLELEDHATWGVVFFKVCDIPGELLHSDGSRWTFAPFHAPTRYNYFHSEVRAARDGNPQSARVGFDRDMSLRWREKLLQVTRNIIWPCENGR